MKQINALAVHVASKYRSVDFNVNAVYIAMRPNDAYCMMIFMVSLWMKLKCVLNPECRWIQPHIEQDFGIIQNLGHFF